MGKGFRYHADGSPSTRPNTSSEPVARTSGLIAPAVPLMSTLPSPSAPPAGLPDPEEPAAPANLRGLAVGSVLLICLAALGATLALVFTSLLGPPVAPDFTGAQDARRALAGAGSPGGEPTGSSGPLSAPRSSGTAIAALGHAIYMPPRPEEAPESIRDDVMLGFRLMNETANLLPEHVGNRLSCSSCHFDGGITEGGRTGGLSLVGVAAKYPIYRDRAHAAVDLVGRTNSCFERSMNGRALDPDSAEMTALMTYYHWISRGIPIYAEVPWLGLTHLASDHRGDPRAGETIYAANCAKCHGADGAGTLLAPPLWGPESFNDGAGMHVPETFAAFTHLNMPKGNPTLTPEQAIDVAAFVTGHPRPHFEPSDGPRRGSAAPAVIRQPVAPGRGALDDAAK